MILWLLVTACGGSGSTGELTCVIGLDKCNTACEPQCLTEAEWDEIQAGTICDIGCLDSADSGPTRECVPVDGDCDWADER